MSNFLGGPVQTGEGLGGLSILTLAYRKVNCHASGCWRIGHFHHGHLVLCGKHHPSVDGPIDASAIERAAK